MRLSGPLTGAPPSHEELSAELPRHGAWGAALEAVGGDGSAYLLGSGRSPQQEATPFTPELGLDMCPGWAGKGQAGGRPVRADASFWARAWEGRACPCADGNRSREVTHLSLWPGSSRERRSDLLPVSDSRNDGSAPVGPLSLASLTWGLIYSPVHDVRSSGGSSGRRWSASGSRGGVGLPPGSAGQPGSAPWGRGGAASSASAGTCLRV